MDTDEEDHFHQRIIDQSLVNHDIPGARNRQEERMNPDPHYVYEYVPQMKYPQYRDIDPYKYRVRFPKSQSPHDEQQFGQKHYEVDQGEIYRTHALHHPYEKEQLDQSKSFARNLDVRDIEGAIPNTLISKVVKNKDQAAQIKIQDQSNNKSHQDALDQFKDDYFKQNYVDRHQFMNNQLYMNHDQQYNSSQPKEINDENNKNKTNMILNQYINENEPSYVGGGQGQQDTGVSPLNGYLNEIEEREMPMRAKSTDRRGDVAAERQNTIQNQKLQRIQEYSYSQNHNYQKNQIGGYSVHEGNSYNVNLNNNNNNNKLERNNMTLNTDRVTQKTYNGNGIGQNGIHNPNNFGVSSNINNSNNYDYGSQSMVLMPQAGNIEYNQGIGEAPQNQNPNYSYNVEVNNLSKLKPNASNNDMNGISYNIQGYPTYGPQVRINPTNMSYGGVELAPHTLGNIILQQKINELKKKEEQLNRIREGTAPVNYYADVDPKHFQQYPGEISLKQLDSQIGNSKIQLRSKDGPINYPQNQMNYGMQNDYAQYQNNYNSYGKSKTSKKK